MSKEITFAVTIKHEGEDWWLAKYTPKNAKQKWPIQQWSSLPEDALTNFKTLNEAEELASKVGGKAVTKEACPRCHGILSEHPAISRKDNQTKICTRCGIREALADFERNKQ